MITNIDLAILMFVQEHLRSAIGNAIMIFITHLEIKHMILEIGLGAYLLILYV